MNTDERVREAMQSLPGIADEVTITSLPTDIEENELIASFVSLWRAAVETSELVLVKANSCPMIAMSNSLCESSAEQARTEVTYSRVTGYSTFCCSHILERVSARSHTLHSFTKESQSAAACSNFSMVLGLSG